MKTSRIIIISLMLIGMVSCSDSGDSPTNGSNNGGTTEPTFTNVKSLLQSTGCASSSCHGGTTPAGKFSTANYSSIVDSAANNGIAVISGDGANSNLYRKVTDNPPFGSRMPLTRDTLTTAQQQLIKDWIDQGALDN